MPSALRAISLALAMVANAKVVRAAARDAAIVARGVSSLRFMAFSGSVWVTVER
jgi:hypothetical protein